MIWYVFLIVIFMILVFLSLDFVYHKKQFLFFAVALIIYVGVTLYVTGLDIPLGFVLGV